jgi:hypothetical protein
VFVVMRVEVTNSGIEAPEQWSTLLPESGHSGELRSAEDTGHRLRGASMRGPRRQVRASGRKRDLA